ncbi:helix-turn-helix transcriptional regulator [Delftia sp. BR1]|nr:MULTISPECIES: S24 family peptidase [Delftia]KAA9174657.1 helix-turn-helix transcriptional regulator [Delftia sp. BR1]
METSGQRLARLRKERGMSQAALAKQAGLSGQGAIGNIENDTRGYGASIIDIARALQTTPEFLRGETMDPGSASTTSNGENVIQVIDDTPPPGYVRLQHLSVRPSMGPGTHMDEAVQIVRHLDVLESWVRKKIGTVNPERIKIMTGNGHSMKPTIQDEDLVFVDMGQRTIDAQGIYVIDVYNRLLLKKALILSDGTLVLRSDNIVDYPDEERIDLRKASECINIAGKVLAWWTMKH